MYMPEGKLITITEEDLPWAQVEDREKTIKERLKLAQSYMPGTPPLSWKIHDLDFSTFDMERIYGKLWGAQGIGKLKEVMLCMPTKNECRKEYFEDPKPFYMFEKTNLTKWRYQWWQLFETFSKEGVLVHRVCIPDDIVGPYGYITDLWACTDAGIVTNNGAIIPREGITDFWKGRSLIYRKAFAELNVPVLFSIHGTAVAEIGGSIWYDNHTFIAGRGVSMNNKGLEQLKTIMNMIGVDVINVDFPGWISDMSSGTIHVDMVCGVTENTVVLFPPFTPYHFVAFLRDCCKKSIIEVPTDEWKYHPMNFVNLEPNKVLMPSGAVKTIKSMEKHGIECVTVDMSEFRKVQGGVDCATCKLIREDSR